MVHSLFFDSPNIYYYALLSVALQPQWQSGIEFLGSLAILGLVVSNGPSLSQYRKSLYGKKQ